MSGEEEPRVGVFICHCGHNIGGTVDVESVAKKLYQLNAYKMYFVYTNH